MKKKLITILTVVLTVSLVLSACGSKDTGQANNDAAFTGEVKEFTIDATNWAFEPAEITVKKGDKVKVTLTNTQGMHGVSFNDFKVNIQGNGTAEFIADKVGSFEYLCSIQCGTGHNDMKGILIVEE